MDYNYNAKKYVVVLSSKLDVGVAFNVVSHLSISAGFYSCDHMGRENLIDASGIFHKGISKYPVIITKVKPSKLKQYIEKAKENKNLLTIDYPSVMYDTGHDDELAEALETLKNEEIEYYGFLVYGNKEDVDSITSKFSLWK